MIKKLIKNNNGSAAIEFIIVILPCLILMFLFLNVLLIIGNLMLSQSSANRTVQQIAALGCLPKDLEERVQDQNSYLGADQVEVRAYSSKYPSTGGFLDNAPGEIENLGDDCSNKASSLSYVVINISYKQDVVLIPGVDSFNMDSEAVSVYSGYSR